MDKDLIPHSGRLLKCSTCHHEWHFIPIIEKKESYIRKEEDKILKAPLIEKDLFKIPEQNDDEIKNTTNHKKASKVTKKKGFFNYLIVTIVSFIAFIILIDTFKLYLISVFPSVEFYLNSFYETINDIFLFVNDLTK